MAPTRLSEQIGRVVGGRYRLVAALGAGASAQVFLADDVRLERQVAVKMLQPVLAEDERFLRRFRAEARTVAAISHPNVVVVHDWGEDDVPYLVTEYLAGGSLRAMLHGGRTLAPSQALVVALDVCRGLAHAHASGLVHRDLKPANVLFDTAGRLRIADFGLARAIAEASVTEPEGAVVGTARYAAPEQARGERLDGRADVYAVALMVVEAVTGAVPFASDTTLGTLMARVERDLEVPAELGPLRPAIERAGRLDPDDRPDAEELGIMLLAASERMNAPAPLPLVGALEEAGLGAPDEQTRTDMVPLPLLDPTEVTAAATSDDATTSVELVPPGSPGSPHVPEAPRRRRRWPLALAALLLVALGAGAFFAVETLRIPSHEIPELTGAQIDELELIAAQNDWVLDRKKTRRNGTEPGEIVSTDPPAGEELDEGATLVVVVSEGNELTAVPVGLEGRPLAEVAAELEAAGLSHAVARRVHHEEIPFDAVVSVEGEIPAQLPRGTALPIVVSDGPEPRTVPEFRVGASYKSVAAALKENELVPVRVEEFSDDVDSGGVIALSEEPGSQVPRDSEITVTVSKGPDLVAVPDVRGKTLAQAEASLEEAGLVLGQDCCNSKGRVVTTDPAPGTKVRRGTEVNVFLAR